jgi:endonuclease G, mitochondrial
MARKYVPGRFVAATLASFGLGYAVGRLGSWQSVEIRPQDSKPNVDVPRVETVDTANAKARKIMKYGFPGPVNDLLYRDSYILSYNRTLRYLLLNRNANWAAEHIYDHPPADGLDRHKAKFVADPDIPKAVL